MPTFRIPERRVGEAAVRAPTPQIGSAVTDMAGMLKTSMVKQEKLEASTKLNQALLDSTDLASEMEKDFPEGKGYAKAYSSKSAELRSKALEAVPFSQKAEASAELDRIFNTQQLKANEREAQMTGSHMLNTATEQQDVIANRIRRGELSAEQGRAQLEIVSNALMEYDVNAAQRLRESGIDTILKSDAMRILEVDGPDVLRERVSSGEFDEMTPGVMDRILSSAKSKERVGINEALSLAKRALGVGAIPDVNLSYEANRADALGLHDEAKELRSLNKNKAKLSQFNALPLQEKQEALKSANLSMRRSASEDSMLYASMVSSAYQNSVNTIKNDSYFYYEENGIIPATSDLDFSAPETFAETILERKAAQDQVMLHEGRPMLQLLKPHEVENLVSIFKTSPTKQKVEFMSSISNAVGWQGFSEMAAQVAPKDRDTARVLALASTKPNVAMEIVQGEGREVDMPPRNDFVNAFHEGGYADAGVPPSVQKDAIETAKKLFTARFSGDKGDIEDTIEKALRDSIGEPVELPNGTKMIAPIREDGTPVGHKELKHAFDELDFGMWIAAIGEFPEDSTGLELSIDQVKEHVKFVPHGPDGYLMVLRHQGTKGFPLTKPDGEIFKVTHGQLVDLVNRAPPTFLQRVFK